MPHRKGMDEIYFCHFFRLALSFISSFKAGEMVDRGDNTYGGKYVVNPSGGLISKGHPLGATGNSDKMHLFTQVSKKA